MMSWKEEFEAFKARTKGSEKAWTEAKRHIPFGVNSNYRLVDPYPMFVSKARGSRMWDVDGNEYIDFNMAFGALVAGHSHPILVKALRDRVANGTIFGYEGDEAGPLAEHMCKRFRMDRIKFSMTGLDSTLFSVRLARAVTGRKKVVKFEGCYHGSHDTLMVSIKPSKEKSGDEKRPTPVPSSRGLLPELISSSVIAPFNDLDATRAIAEENADDLAAIILEPIPMNMGLVLPKPGFLEGLRKIADDTGAVVLHFESGMLAVLNHSAVVAYPRTNIELHGTEGSLLIEGFGDEVSLLRMEEQTAEVMFTPEQYLEATRGLGGLEGGFTIFLDQLAAAITTGAPPPDLPTFKDGWEVTRLIDAAKLASHERRRVKLSEVG